MRRLELEPIMADGEYGESLKAPGDFTIISIQIDSADTSKDPSVKAKWKLRSKAEDAPTRRVDEARALRALGLAEKNGSGLFAFTVVPGGDRKPRCKRLDESLFIYEV